jgi:plasmid maintenance system antidote protein VapI
MTRDELRSLGEATGRRGWQTSLARSLPVNPRTVRAWLAGKRKIHPAMAERIKDLLSLTHDGVGNMGK